MHSPVLQVPVRRLGTYARGEDTRRRLIETAIEAFGAYGYEGTSTRMLADRAGVNLPAIPYYFGSKQGLYRAAVEHILESVDEHMTPIAARVRTALTRKSLSRKEMMGLLNEMLDAFVAMWLGYRDRESRRRFMTRAELENDPAVAALHERVNRHTVGPCTALLARILGEPAKAQTTVLRLVMILGQVSVFCHKGAMQAIGWSDFNDARVRAVQRMVRENAAAILRAANGARS